MSERLKFEGCRQYCVISLVQTLGFVLDWTDRAFPISEVTSL